MRLVVRTTLRADESLLGFVLRLCDLNGYAHPGWFIDHQEAPIHICINSPDFAQKLSFLTDTPSEQLMHHAYIRNNKNYISFLHNRLNRKYANLNVTKICPHCLKEKGHHAFYWDSVFFRACPEHGTHMVNHCLGCGAILTWARPGIRRCPQGHDVTQAEPPTADPRLIWYARLIRAAALKNKDTAPGSANILPWESLSIQSLSNLTVFLGSLRLKAAERQAAFQKDRRSLDLDHWITSAADVLRHWPSCFHEEMQRIRDGMECWERSDLVKQHAYSATSLCAPRIDFVRAEIQTFNKLYGRHLLSQKSVAGRLGLEGRCHTSRLTKPRLIRRPIKYTRMPSDRATIEYLFRDLDSVAKTPKILPDDLVNLPMIGESIKRVNILDVIGLSLEGKIPLYKDVNRAIGLHRYLVSLREVKLAATAEEISFNEKLSWAAACKLIGCSRHVLAMLVKSNLVPGGRKNGTQHCGIERHAIDTFNTHYTLASNFAFVLGTTLNHTTAMLDAHGVERLRPHSVKGFPAIFKRAQVERLLPCLKNLLRTPERSRSGHTSGQQPGDEH